MNAQLLDERAAESLRDRVGRLLARATHADFALARLRIAGIELPESALDGLRRCRMLIGRLDADTLAAPAPELAGRIAGLRGFVESGRLELRAAGLVVWTPDFSLLHGIDSHPTGHVALVGAHYLVRPSADGGPSLTCILDDADSVKVASTRFDELWEQGYDVTSTVHDALDRIVETRGEHPFPHSVESCVTHDRTET